MNLTIDTLLQHPNGSPIERATTLVATFPTPKNLLTARRIAFLVLAKEPANQRLEALKLMQTIGRRPDVAAIKLFLKDSNPKVKS